MSLKHVKPPHAVTWAIPLERVMVNDPFWSPRQEMMATASLLRQYTKLEEYHHINNFRIATGELESTFIGMFYYDSDAYKWIEAATYALFTIKNEMLVARVEELVALVVRSQQPDGYVNTFFTALFPEARMKYFYVMHELYCGGHMIEAAVARFELFGKHDLLDCAIKFADYLLAFDPAGANKQFMPGHPEIELALIRLYRCTGVQKYLDLAVRFIEARGRDPQRLRTALANVKAMAMLLNRQSKALRAWELQHGKITRPTTKIALDTAPASFLHKLRFASSYLSGKYLQQHMPAPFQHKPVGHAVRAAYLYSGMADVLVERGDATLLAALTDTWQHMTRSRMYINGGIGALPLIEGFGNDYELDNEHAYCETCAAIGNFLWNWRMLQATGGAEHADLMELLLYNAILPGWSIDGLRYRYTNPLSSRSGFAHQEWFDCACCPPNIGRIVSGLGQYITATDGESTVTIGLYIGCHVEVPLTCGSRLTFDISSGFPWDTQAKIVFKETPNHPLTIQLRVPAWTGETRVTINDEKPTNINDWAIFHSIEQTWKPGDIVHIEFKAAPAYVLPDPRVRADHGRVAIKQGPIIYCIERADNPTYEYDRMMIDIKEKLESRLEPSMLGGVKIIEGKLGGTGSKEKERFTAIPYFAWGNREKGPMQVWLKCGHRA